VTCDLVCQGRRIGQEVEHWRHDAEQWGKGDNDEVRLQCVDDSQWVLLFVESLGCPQKRLDQIVPRVVV